MYRQTMFANRLNIGLPPNFKSLKKEQSIGWKTISFVKKKFSDTEGLIIIDFLGNVKL